MTRLVSAACCNFCKLNRSFAEEAECLQQSVFRSSFPIHTQFNTWLSHSAGLRTSIQSGVPTRDSSGPLMFLYDHAFVKKGDFIQYEYIGVL